MPAPATPPSRLPLLRRESLGTRLGETGVNTMRNAYWLLVLLFALLIPTIGLGKGTEVLEALRWIYSLGPSLAAWATVTAGAMAVIGVCMARHQIRISNSIRRTELISNTYDAFLTDDLLPFYDKIRKGETINWQRKKDDEQQKDDKQQKDDEQLLNKSLTLFDKVDYLRTQGLLDERAWEYVASEIQYFASNPSVWDYMFKRIHEGLCRGFPKDIIPFTGFPDLLENIPHEFRANPFPEIPERHRAFFNQLKSSR